MASTTIENRTELSPTVPAVLGGLRLRIRLYVWLHGLTTGVAWLGAAFWISLGIDWCFEPSPIVRKVMLVAVGVVLAAILLKLIVLRAFAHLGNSSMAMVLERRFGQLDDTLLTAVLLTDQGHQDEEFDRKMLAQTCREAEERVASITLRRVFNPGPLLRSLAAAVVLASSVVAFATLSSEAFAIWTDRALRFSAELWPRKTFLTVEGFDENGVKKIARGSALDIVALADTSKEADNHEGVVPRAVEIYYRSGNGSRKRERMNMKGDAARSGQRYQRFSYSFPPILAPITFEVAGGDYRTREYRIEVVDSPTIKAWTLHCEYPAYMNRPPSNLPITAVMQIPRGTEATVRTWPNKDLVRVQIDIAAGETPAATEIMTIDPILDAKWTSDYVARIDRLIQRQEKITEELQSQDTPQDAAGRLQKLAADTKKLNATMTADVQKDRCRVHDEKRGQQWVSRQVDVELRPDYERLGQQNADRSEQIRERLQSQIADFITADEQRIQQQAEDELKRMQAAMQQQLEATAKELEVSVGPPLESDSKQDQQWIAARRKAIQQQTRQQMQRQVETAVKQAEAKMKAEVEESLREKKEAAQKQFAARLAGDRIWIREQLDGVAATLTRAFDRMAGLKQQLTKAQQGPPTKKMRTAANQAIIDLKRARTNLVRIPRGFQYRLGQIAGDTTLSFTLFDTDGIRSREPMRLGLSPVADTPPELVVRLRGIGPAITPQARLPATGRIVDDYGIANAHFEYTIDPEGEESKTDRLPIPIPPEPPHPTELPVDLAMEVRDLQLTPGQKLVVSVKAQDRYNLGDNPAVPNEGTSDRWLKEIVTPEHLRSLLEARELVLRQRFETTIEKVTESRDRMIKIGFDASAENGDNGVATDEGAEPGDEVVQTLSPQQQLERRIAYVQRALQDSRQYAHETKGVAEAFDEIRLELINNRIDIRELNDRIEFEIAKPLHRIADDMFPLLEQRLIRLEELLEDTTRGPQQRTLARQQADLILREMNRVLDKMTELEDFNEALELLRTIIKLQEELGEQTKQRQKDKLRELLED